MVNIRHVIWVLRASSIEFGEIQTHVPLVLCFITNITLSFQVGYYISMMKSTFYLYLTSSPMAPRFSFSTIYFLIVTGLVEALTTRRWYTTLVSIHGLSDGSHTKKSKFLMSWLKNSCSSSSKKEVSIFSTW